MREGRNFILKWLRAEAELFQVFLEQMHIDWPLSIKITSLTSHQTLRKMHRITCCSYNEITNNLGAIFESLSV